MIRQFSPEDIDKVLDIWLTASIQAHDFVAADYWKSQLEDMRHIYIPASKTNVFESDGCILGFYSICDHVLAAIFVLPEYQGQGVGKQLMAHAKAQCAHLTLTVYKDNQASYKFYLSQGFKVDNEQVCKHTGCTELAMSPGS